MANENVGKFHPGIRFRGNVNGAEMEVARIEDKKRNHKGFANRAGIYLWIASLGALRCGGNRMENEKRLTWKRSLDGYTDVGLCDGVTLQKVITVEGYKMFTDTMRICWQHPECPPQEIYGDWLYRPDTGYWYCDGKSYLADNCTIVEKL